VSTTEGIRQRSAHAVETLTPGYFALVMASGIISVGMHLQGLNVLAHVLLVICAVAFVVLLVLNVWRAMRYREAMVADFMAPERAFGFFTLVAGTNVLGVRLGVQGWHWATGILLGFSGLVWLVLGYVVPWTAVLSRRERPVVKAANGTWFIWVVASQSVAVAAASLEPVAEPIRRELALLAVGSWSVGVFLYVAAAIFVSLRMMTYDLRPEDLTPPYWVAMGAVAITVLAGARIVEMADAPMVAVTRDLVAGLAVVFWSFATWLIPVLVAAGWWRHWHWKVPLRYEATLWSIIFPLGMYAVAGIYLGEADRLPVVAGIGAAELWVAFAAFVLVFVTMVRHVWQTVFVPRAVPEK
jgi:tellurite resistance protein TehA-like permease